MRYRINANTLGTVWIAAEHGSKRAASGRPSQLAVVLQLKSKICKSKSQNHRVQFRENAPPIHIFAQILAHFGTLGDARNAHGEIYAAPVRCLGGEAIITHGLPNDLLRAIVNIGLNLPECQCSQVRSVRTVVSGDGVKSS
jgi:hypothetical protein